MLYYKRSLVSITRRKTRSLALFLIILVLGIIMLTALIIVLSVEAAKDSIMRKLPPVVALEFDHEAARKTWDSDGYKATPDLTYSDLERIEEAAGAYIKTTDFCVSESIETDSLVPYRAEGDGIDDAFADTPHYFTFQGVSTPIFALLELGNARIIEGRTFTREEIDKGSPVIIMSKELAQVNNCKVGDIIAIRVPLSSMEVKKVPGCWN